MSTITLIWIYLFLIPYSLWIIGGMVKDYTGILSAKLSLESVISAINYSNNRG